ncbi:hypothetical protein ALC57_02598 [Trachymyrmex cornetzi]|uniref:CCHC-type domain-containing protein n=1 Tax=Trachymyrmex cornetzi TaxID=471704 RepID=A0A151JNW7_9HYME|nr:hypothetical protein ALC57_02598 [Trachymyrmex cornetzi]
MCRNNNNVNFSSNKNSVVYQWCDNFGHLAANCWQRQNSERNFDNKTNIICHICNNPEHIARDCRSKSNQQSNSKISIFYRYCKETSHLLEACQLRIASNNRRKTTHQGNSDGPSKAKIRPITVNLYKHGRVPTVETNLFGSTPVMTFMLDIGSGPNIIKETFIPKGSIIDHNNILKLNGINEYPSGIRIPFLSPETIIASPRSEPLFYVRIENPEIKIGYVPKLKIAHGIYLGATIVENVSGKAYLNVISTLDEEVEVQVPTLRLFFLNL